MTKKTFVIGRDGDIILDDDTVSRRHAQLDISKEGLFLTDLESSNGTFLIEGNQRIPFRKGPVQASQPVAFGECIRTVGSLLESVETANSKASNSSDLKRRCSRCGAVIADTSAFCSNCGAIQ